MLYLGHFSGQLGWTPWGEGSFLFFVIWFTPIHNRMSHYLGVGILVVGSVKFVA